MNSLFASGGALENAMQQAEIALRDNTRSSIIFAVVDDPYATPDTAFVLRDEVMWELAARLYSKYTLYELNCATTEEQSIPRYCRRLKERPACLFASNLDAVARDNAKRYRDLIDSLNSHREDIRDTKTAFVLWLTSETLRDVQALAPDFAGWRTACITFTVKQGINVGRIAPGISVQEADELRHEASRYEEMLTRPNLEPAMAAEFQQQCALLYRQLGQREESEAASRAGAVILTELSALERTERIYLDYLIEKYGSLDPRGITQTVKNVTLPLDEVYVSLTATREVSGEFLLPDKMDEATRARFDMMASLGDPVEPLDLPSAATYYVDRAIPLQFQHLKLMRRQSTTEKVDLPRAVRESSRMVILGDPGAGKTTLTKFLAMRFALACRDDAPTVIDNEYNDYGKTRLPIPLRVAGFADALRRNRNLSLREYLPQAFGDVPVPLADLIRLFDQALHDNAAFMLLDGLDEVADAGDRIEIARAIDSFVVGIGPQNRVLVTSRIAGYREARLGAVFQQYTLRDMEPEQIARFLRRWCLACERFHTPNAAGSVLQERAEAERSAILAAVKKSVGVGRLAGNPLLLTILTLIHRNSARLPERRIELYQLAANTLLRDWRLAQAGSEARVVEEYEALELLGPLAYEMHENEPTGLIDADRAYELLCRFHAEARGLKPDHPDVQAAIEDFLRRIREQTGVFVERAPGKYGFMHLTFEEYFAAREIVSDFVLAADRIRPHRHHPRWEEPIRLAIAYERPKNAAHLIRTALWDKSLPVAPEAPPSIRDRIFSAFGGKHSAPPKAVFVPSRYEEILHRDLLLAARCLGDCAAVDPALSREIAAELVEIHLRPGGNLEYPILTRLVGNALTELRGSDVGAEVLRLILAVRKAESPWVRAAAVDALGMVGRGTPEILSALLEAITDKEFFVRYQAAKALGMVGNGSPECLNALLAALDDEDTYVQTAAAEALVTIGQTSPDVLDAVLSAARHGNSSVRAVAVNALGTVSQGSSQVLTVLLAALNDKESSDKESEVRSAAARALGTVGQGSAKVLNALLAVLEDQAEECDVRSAATQALGMMGQAASQSLDALLAALNDKEMYVRFAAAGALGTVGQGSTEVLNALLAVLNDEGEENYGRACAMEALGAAGQGSAEVLFALIAALEHDHYWMRSAAVKALETAGQGSPEALKALLTAIKDKDSNVRSAVAGVLRTLGQGSTEALNVLLIALKDEDSHVRSAVVRALGTVGQGSQEALDAVLAALEDDDRFVRNAAWEALWQLTAIQE